MTTPSALRYISSRILGGLRPKLVTVSWLLWCVVQTEEEGDATRSDGGMDLGQLKVSPVSVHSSGRRTQH